MIKMSRKAKKAMAVALTAGMLASTAATPVMAATEGWKQNTKGWWYQNADGSYPANKWEKINGKWYYFDANGYMKANSWAQDKAGKWYYVGADGAMKTNSWAQDKKGLWYYVGNDGAMVTNTWAKDKAGLWYFLGADGVMEAGKWITVGGKNYFLAADGVMQSGVITVEGKTYYLGAYTDGAMKTGEIEIAGTKYNFGTDGVCTSETVPAAYKHFDKNGNEIIPEIEVEQVSDLTCEITNALSDYKEYGNVVIAGNNAYLKVLVTDAKGKPVANTPVAIKKEYRGGAYYGGYVPQSTVENTNSEGYATFVFSAKDPTIEATTPGTDELMTITATAVQINKSKTIDLSFAYVDLGDINLNNHDDEFDSLVEVPSKNADPLVHGIAATKSTDGNANVEYVVSQQASDKGSTNHKVEFEVNPSLVLPHATKDGKIDEYVEEVNKEIKEYSVYHDDKDQIKIAGVPAGLKYISVDFAKLDISEYTHVQIQKYYAGTDTPAGEPYIIEGPTTKSNCTYQIPVQNKYDEYDLVVKIISKGQVDDDQNGGLVLSKVHGPYDSDKASTRESIPFGTVTWSETEIVYSNDMTLSYKDAAAYIPDSAEKYEDVKYTYIYQVPAFPYVGNAIMTVKDENKKVIAYFTIPTENEWNNKYQNENVLIDTVYGEGKAILVSKDEAFGKEGTITQEGNKVTVNSEKTGVTALKAKISVPGFEDQVNVTNDTLYTSVHWSPLPNEVVNESDDFYALVGQDIVVKAQLVDKNGNKVSQAGEEITFKYTEKDGKVDEIDKLGAIGKTKASASEFKASTDANGQTTLKITSADELAKVESLSAESGKYDVHLTIGDQTVSKATLRWVEAGLSFTDRSRGTAEVIDTLDQTKDKDSVLVGNGKGYLVKDAGTNWIFGYEVKGETEDDYDFYISGLKVDVAKGGEGTLTTTGMDNGSAKLTSSKTGVSTLTGTVNEKSVVKGTDVIFHIDGKDYKNVGEGNSTINASLNLPINWGNVGTSVSIISPKGSKLVYSGDGKTTFENAYVKVVDELGNDLKAEVEVRVTYTLNDNDGTTVEADFEGNTGVAEFKTNSSEKGLVAVKLQKAIGEKDVKSALIVAKVGNAEPTKYTVNYETTPSAVADFKIGEVVYEEQTTTSNPKVRVIFTTNVNATTLKKAMFNITDEKNNKLNIASVQVGDRQNEVVITLSNTHATGLDYTKTYTVNVVPYVEKEVIKYELCDTYFRTFAKDSLLETGDNASNKFQTSDTGLESARKKVSDAVADEIADKEAAIAAKNTNDIESVAAKIGYKINDDGVIVLSEVEDTMGTTVVVAEGTDEDGIIDVTDNKVTVNATEALKGKTATFTITVTKGTGAQAGTPSVKTYTVTIDGKDKYTVADVVIVEE